MFSNLPKITVVTPSFNQVEFLERTILSVLNQDYPNLEYVVIDGGSTDGSVDIIRKYEDRLAYWVSEPDRGQTEAINKGLRRATGEWLAWQNSDDVYYPGVFWDVARAAARHPEADLIIGNMKLIDSLDHELRYFHYVTPSHGALLAEGMVLTNQAAFWRRGVHDEIGWLDESLHYCFDYEWFLRLTEKHRGVHVNKLWGGYRLHDETKTHNMAQRFNEERTRVLQGRIFPRWKVKLFQLRRAVLMLGQGEIGDVLRGLIRRAQGKGGELY
jgi:glycosyltransferase involved in cell wall biosynthesis